MSKKLLIAEKPSVAKDFARVLGVPRKGAFYENDSYIISHAVGHLLGINIDNVFPKDAALPILPDLPIPLSVTKDGAAQFKILKDLLSRSDVATVYNCCDPDREGELIFRSIYEQVKCSKPVMRSMLYSQTDEGYREAYKDARPGSEYDGLGDAAHCRNEADASFGINGSRAIKGSFGRVNMPTLNMVVAAYHANRNFVPKDYWEIHGDFGVTAGTFSAKLLDETGNIRKFEERSHAEALMTSLNGANPSAIKDEGKISKSRAPKLMRLTTAQKELSKKYKFSPDKSLGIIDKLYNEYKCLTYPRTDYDGLWEKDVAKVAGIVSVLQQMPEFSAASSAQVKADKYVFDDSRCGAHYAIIPTGRFLPSGANSDKSIAEVGLDKVKASLSADEWKVFEFMLKRFLSVFMPPAEYSTTTRTVTVKEHTFRTSGKVLVNAGYLALYGGKDDDDKKEKEPPLPALAAGETGETKKLNLKDLKTKAPPLLTEAGLLTAMETAGKHLNEDLADVMADKGLGTSATRHEIIKKLQTGTKSNPMPYMQKEKDVFVPTERGIKIIEYLQKLAPKYIDPAHTGEWEYKLLQMSEGKYKRSDFMREIYDAVTDFVNLTAATPFKYNAQAAEGKELCDCPACGSGKVKEGVKTWSCTCGFAMWKSICGKTLTRAQVKELCTKGETDKIDGFKLERDGKKSTFSAKLVLLEKDGKPVAGFPPKQAAKESQHNCPNCKERMVERDKVISCNKCQTAIWKEYGGVTLSEEQLAEIIQNGRTSKTLRLKSQKGSEYDAFVTLVKEDGVMKMKPEFPPAAKSGHKCPCCGKAELEDKPALLSCPSCKFALWKSIYKQVTLSEAQIATLIDTGELKNLGGFTSKAGKAYAVDLFIDKEAKKVETKFAE